MARLLVVDDEPAIRSTLEEILRQAGYEVTSAGDGQEALELARAASFDLVLSDISMPRMTGIQLLKEIEQILPEAHRVLLTGHTLEEYINELLEHSLSCVLTKSVPFPVTEILTTVDALLRRDIFGVRRHVSPDARIERHPVRTHMQIGEICEHLAEMVHPRRQTLLHTILNEILTNAVYYGVRGELGDRKESWSRDFELPPDMAVQVEVAIDADRKAFAITDQGGKLNRGTVLHWLNRQMSKDENGLPLGVFDNHGRGFFITRSFADRVAISIEKGMRSEVVLVMYDESPPAGEKPLIILEI